ncbi:MAG TPA: hypothetical protein VJA21_19445 [Verrucomicrobiae bacterium]
MNTNKVETAESKPLRTFLVRYGVATLGLSGERENFGLGLVEAPDVDVARALAWAEHVDEEFEDGRWVKYNGHRAFQLSEDAPDIDANCIYWLDDIKEVPDADAGVLRKYLSLARLETSIDMTRLDGSDGYEEQESLC